MDVEFKDLCYTVRPRAWGRNFPEKCVLKSVSGCFKSGQLSAIMGPSGAGKSSLLNAVSGYRTCGVTGKLCTNGKPRDSRIFHKLSCYITQDDLLQPLLTVQEIMTVAAKLKLPTHMNNKQKQLTINEILSDLCLFESRNTRTEHLSGGQKKRLSIALELINNPPVFFLDEPTSGLDNVTTKQVVQLLRTLARQGRTIVCTIHQPSASIFELFDHVYIVAKGLCVYQGTTQELIPFLSSMGLHCPTHYNPADFVIEVTDGEEQNIKALSRAIHNGKLSWTQTHVICATTTTATDDSSESKCEEEQQILEKYTLHFKPTKDIATIDNGNKSNDSSSEASSADLGSSMTYKRMNQVKDLDYPTSTWFQFCALLTRMMLQISRNQIAFRLQTIHHVICALMFGIITFQSASDGLEMFKHVKYCMGIILFHSYTWCMTPVLLFPNEVKLMKKEYFNRWYALTPFYLAFTISKLPGMIFHSMIFLTCVYFMNGLPAEAYRFFLFCLTGITVSLVAEGMGLAIGSMFSVTNGCAIGPLIVAPFLGLAAYGFDYAQQISWMMYVLMKLSFMRCGIVALVLTVFGLDRKDLDCDDIYCHFKKPTVILQMLDIEHVSVWTELLALFVTLIVFRGICYFGLRWRVKT